MIRLEFEGKMIRFSSAEEAVRFLQLQKQEDPDTGGWTTEMFWRFIERLGSTQQHILDQLRYAPRTDDELKADFNLKTNQQLAGVLSGISKQAAALGIPARSVFKIEKEYKSGKSITTYKLDAGFAARMEQVQTARGR
jgi:hypothetical protein